MHQVHLIRCTWLPPTLLIPMEIKRVNLAVHMDVNGGLVYESILKIKQLYSSLVSRGQKNNMFARLKETSWPLRAYQSSASHHKPVIIILSWSYMLHSECLNYWKECYKLEPSEECWPAGLEFGTLLSTCANTVKADTHCHISTPHKCTYFITLAPCMTPKC